MVYNLFCCKMYFYTELQDIHISEIMLFLNIILKVIKKRHSIFFWDVELNNTITLLNKKYNI